MIRTVRYMDPHTTDGIETKPSPDSVPDTEDRLGRLLKEKGLKVFAVIDHSGEAAKAGLSMPDTKLVFFGSATAGTPLMVAAPLAAIDLPLKLLIWADTDGAVSVSYNSPAYLAARHHLTDDLATRVQPIEALSDALVSRGD
jgi:uncharacterized protein (DUF302 family)